MRHRLKFRRLRRPTAHRWALLRNLVSSLIEHERIVTTDSKAKELRHMADWMITLARKQDPHSRMQANAVLIKPELTEKLFTQLAFRYQYRPCGFTRILKVGQRKNDAAKMSVIEFVDREGEIRQAKACTPVTVLKNIEQTSPMTQRIRQRNAGLKKSVRNAYLINLLRNDIIPNYKNPTSGTGLASLASLTGSTSQTIKD